MRNYSAQLKLIESETRFRSLVEQWFAGIFVITERGKATPARHRPA